MLPEAPTVDMLLDVPDPTLRLWGAPGLLDATEEVAAVLVAALHLQRQDGSTVSAKYAPAALARDRGRDGRGNTGCVWALVRGREEHAPPQPVPAEGATAETMVRRHMCANLGRDSTAVRELLQPRLQRELLQLVV